MMIGWEKSSGHDGYVYGLYDSDGFMRVSPNASSHIHSIHRAFDMSMIPQFF